MQSYAPDGVSPVRSMVWSKGSESRNRMREIFTYGSVGGALGNWCFYPERDRWGCAPVPSLRSAAPKLKRWETFRFSKRLILSWFKK